MSAPSLPQNPGISGWLAILPDAPAFPRLEHHVTADWLVIGAGFAGLSAALRLRDLCPGDRIVVLDACRVAEGPAGRNSGFMIDLPHDLASADYGGDLSSDAHQIQGNRHAIAFAKAAQDRFDMPSDTLRHEGKINGAGTNRGLRQNRDYARHLRALDQPHEMLDARQMRAITGSDFYLGGLFTPGTAVLQPAQYIRELAKGLVGLGVSIYENSPVTHLKRNTIWRANTPNGSVSAPKVILAVNGHVQGFGHFANRLMHVHTYASMTRALTSDECARLGGHAHWGITPADPMGSTIRRISGLGGTRLVVRNRFTYDPSMRVPKGRLARVARDHDTAFKARFKTLCDVEMQYRWGGHLCLSRNNSPAFAEVDTDLYTACCQNGLGTTKGTLAGILAAEKATGHDSALLQQFEALPPPPSLPPGIIFTPAARSYLSWSERRAGAEL